MLRTDRNRQPICWLVNTFHISSTAYSSCWEIFLAFCLSCDTECRLRTELGDSPRRKWRWEIVPTPWQEHLVFPTLMDRYRRCLNLGSDCASLDHRCTHLGPTHIRHSEWICFQTTLAIPLIIYILARALPLIEEQGFWGFGGQKKGKARMRQFGSVDIPQEAFIEVLKINKNE